MAKKPKGREFVEPNERELQGIQQLIQMVAAMQIKMQEEAPEEYAKMMEQAQQYERRK